MLLKIQMTFLRRWSFQRLVVLLSLRSVLVQLLSQLRQVFQRQFALRAPCSRASYRCDSLCAGIAAATTKAGKKFGRQKGLASTAQKLSNNAINNVARLRGGVAVAGRHET